MVGVVGSNPIAPTKLVSNYKFYKLEHIPKVLLPTIQVVTAFISYCVTWESIIVFIAIPDCFGVLVQVHPRIPK